MARTTTGLLVAFVTMILISSLANFQAFEVDADSSIISITPGASSKTTDAFAPNRLVIAVGDTVTWKNKDSQPHTVTSGKGPDDPISGLEFDSSPSFNPLMAPGATFSHTFSRAGTYHYHCSLHPNMIGVVDVKATITDFNVDGYADLAIGVPFEDAMYDNSAVDSGAVNVIYGSSSGLKALGGNRQNQLWSQDADGISGIAESGDMFGSALAVGDFNGDHASDLAIGVPFEDVGAKGGTRDAGAVNVIYGTRGGGLFPNILSGGGGRDDQMWTQSTSGVEGSIEPNDRFGAQLAAGDFNCDERDDLAIGVPGQDVGPYHDAGAIAIIYGSGVGLSVALTDDLLLTRESSEIEGFASDNLNFPTSLQSGDFNGDGCIDLAIGVRHDNVDGGPDAGSVNVIYGSGAGLSATFAVPDQLWSQNSPGIEGQMVPGDGFGIALASGHFNNDSYEDLAVGSIEYALNHETEEPDRAGGVNVIYGSPSGLSATFRSDQLWTQDSPGIQGKSEDGDEYGLSLTTADLNGDGYSELAVGIRSEDTSLEDSGMVGVIYSSSSGLTSSDQLFTQATPGIDGTTERLEFFGWSLTSGDYDGDGNDDLVVGVDESIGGEIGVGAVHVISSQGGSANTGISYKEVLWRQEKDGVKGMMEAGDHFGSAVA